MIHGRSDRLLLLLVQIQLAPTRGLFLLLALITSMPWIWMVILALDLKPQWKIKIILPPLVREIGWIPEKVRGCRMWTTVASRTRAWHALLRGQRRMALTRLGRHEGHCLELPRYGPGPRQ